MQNLPCPFCGGLEQEIYDCYYDGWHILVYCKYGAQAGETEDEQRAIALWNTRATVEVFQETPMEYLPCPFCGGQEQENCQQGKDFWLWCLCGAQGSHATDREGAITAWNTRVNNQVLEKN